MQEYTINKKNSFSL